MHDPADRDKPPDRPRRESSTAPPAFDAEGKDERLRELEETATEQQRRLDGMLRIAANLGRSRDPKKAMRAMVTEISELLDADRTTVYAIDREAGLLTGLAVQGEASVEVGVPIGQGIAGLVAERGRAINLKDAYRHPAFDPKFDKLTGYRTRSMLAVPMRNPKREITGVVQVLNKREGYFTIDDQNLLTALAAQAAITLEALQLQLQLNISNAELRELSRQLEQRVVELELLYDNEQAAAEAETLDALADRALRAIARVTRCEAAALYLPDESGFGAAWLRGPDDDLPLRPLCRIEVGDGILGKTASRGEPYVLSGEAFEDAAMPRDLGGSCGFPVHDSVSAPLVDGVTTLGTLALLNRRDGSRRDDDEDRRLAVLLAGQLARAVGRIEQRRSLQQRDRLMTIGQMLSGVLHDMRGPMAIINGYAQLMADTADPAERDEMAQAMRRQVQLFDEMTREVIAFARGERQVLARKVYLDKFVKMAKEQLQPEFDERGVRLEVRQLASNGLAWFDEAKMLRVVTNIARNARQALGDQGTLVWTIRDAADGGITFELKDDGPGIPESIRDRIFEAFTTSGKRDGTGLGLAIVRRIVEDHQGTIAVETETGVGTQFTVHLPPAKAA